MRSPRRYRLSFLASFALVLLLGAGLWPRQASAFCGFYVSGADTKLFANASQVVLMREGTRTVLSMQNDYQGPPESFAMVVPVPVVLQKENVKTLPRELFARIDQLDAPRLVEYWEQDPCYVRPLPKPRSASGKGGGALTPAPPAGAAKDLGVTIEAQFTVGEYEIVVLGAKDSSGLDIWLRREGYKIPEGSEPLLRPYVQNGSKFFVARVDVTKVKMENASGVHAAKGARGARALLSPLRFHYDSPQLALPIRLGLVNSPGTQDLIVHVLGKGKRYEVANYPNVTIPTNLDVAENAKGRFGSFYAALFDKTLEKTPTAVVTEYAWDAGSCDPCPSPPLTEAELVTLGADVLPSVTSETEQMDRELLKALGAQGAKPTPGPAGGGPPTRRTYYGLGSSFVLTRLHARYSRDALGDDLVLKEAPPLHGGREVRTGGDGQGGGNLETTATVGKDGSGQSAFQGRYAVRHPWAGPITCEKPVRNRWGGPPNGLDNGGAKPALDLAYAPRDNVQLASFLRSDVSTLGLTAAGVEPSGVGTFSPPSASPPTSGDASRGDDGGTSGGSGGAAEAKKSGCGSCATTNAPGGAGWVAAVVAVLALVVRRRKR